MASTIPANIDTSIPEVWAALTLRDHLREGFWGKFAGGEGSGSPIIQRTELLNKPGDLIHIQVGSPLSGAGVTGDLAVLEGNEENLTLSELKVAPYLTRHGVRVHRRSNKKSIVDLRQEARMRLAEWGQDKMDQIRWSQFVSATASDVPDATYSPNVRYASTTQTLNSLAASDKMSVALIKGVRYRLLANKAKPYSGPGGMPKYFLVISPEQEFDLKADTDYKNYVINAASRGYDNPVFTGAIADIDGVVIFSHFNVPIVTNGSSVRCAKAIAFGQDAFVEGVDEAPSWAERDFDYGAQLGVGYSFAFQPRRALELSSLQVVSSAVQPA